MGLLLTCGSTIRDVFGVLALRLWNLDYNAILIYLLILERFITINVYLNISLDFS